MLRDGMLGDAAGGWGMLRGGMLRGGMLWGGMLWDAVGWDAAGGCGGLEDAVGWDAVGHHQAYVMLGHFCTLSCSHTSLSPHDHPVWSLHPLQQRWHVPPRPRAPDTPWDRVPLSKPELG